MANPGKRMPGFDRAGLKPDDSKRADQSEQCADLKLPLANDMAFLGKKTSASSAVKMTDERVKIA